MVVFMAFLAYRLFFKLPFAHLVDRSFKLGCGVWYFLAMSVITAIMTVVVCGIVKWYKKRRRDENIYDEHVATSQRIQH